MSSNLPPGVTENMIPGNRPEDQLHGGIDADMEKHKLSIQEAIEIWKLGMRRYLEAFEQAAECCDAIDHYVTELWGQPKMDPETGKPDDGESELQLAMRQASKLLRIYNSVRGLS